MVVLDMANAGGLSVSEWVQNLQNYYWTREEVEEKLERLMVKAFGSVYERCLKGI
jgi:glutamate dehydrogenase